MVVFIWLILNGSIFSEDIEVDILYFLFFFFFVLEWSIQFFSELLSLRMPVILA